MFVYVIQAANGPVKVGITNHMGKRLSGLATAAAYELSVVHSEEVSDDNARRVESAAHGILSRHRLRGEWFSCSPDDAVAAILAAKDQPDRQEPLPSHFVAVFEPSETGVSVYFPDLPGCTSAGRDSTAATLNAAEALQGHCATLLEAGDLIPLPRSLEDIADEIHSPNALGVIPTLWSGKSVRLNITLDEGLVAAIDRVAKNRSGFLADAARTALAAKRELADA